MKKDIIILNLLNINLIYMITLANPMYLSFNVWALIILLNFVFIAIQMKYEIKFIVILKYVMLISYPIFLLIKPNQFLIPVQIIYYLFIVMQFLFLSIELKLQKRSDIIIPISHFIICITFIFVGLVFYKHALWMVDYHGSSLAPGMEIKYKLAAYFFISIGIIGSIFTVFKRVIIINNKDIILLNLLNINLFVLIAFISQGFIWYFMILINLVLIILQNKDYVKIKYLNHTIPILYSFYLLIEIVINYQIYYNSNDFFITNFIIRRDFLIFSLFIFLQFLFIVIESKMKSGYEKMTILIKCFTMISFILIGLKFYEYADYLICHSCGVYDGIEIKYQILGYISILIGVIGLVLIANKNMLFIINLFNILFIIMNVYIPRFYVPGYPGSDVWSVVILAMICICYIQTKVESKWLVYIKYLIIVSYPIYDLGKFFIPLSIPLNKYYGYNQIPLKEFLLLPKFIGYYLLIFLQILFLFFEQKLKKNNKNNQYIRITLLLFLVSMSSFFISIYYHNTSLLFKNSSEPYKNTQYIMLMIGSILFISSIISYLYNLKLRNKGVAI